VGLVDDFATENGVRAVLMPGRVLEIFGRWSWQPLAVLWLMYSSVPIPRRERSPRISRSTSGSRQVRASRIMPVPVGPGAGGRGPGKTTFGCLDSVQQPLLTFVAPSRRRDPITWLPTRSSPSVRNGMPSSHGGGPDRSPRRRQERNDRAGRDRPVRLGVTSPDTLGCDERICR
jgi:hypothetical protein